MAFITRRPQGIGVWASAIGGEGGRFIAPFGGAKWSPINSQLAYTDADRLWVVDTNNPNARRQTLPTTTAGPMRWTPDARSLRYRSAQDTIRIVAADGKSPDRLLVNLSGRRGGLGDHGTPTDGTWIYFTRDEDLGELWAMDLLPPAR